MFTEPEVYTSTEGYEISAVRYYRGDRSEVRFRAEPGGLSKSAHSWHSKVKPKPRKSGLIRPTVSHHRNWTAKLLPENLVQTVAGPGQIAGRSDVCVEGRETTPSR